MASRAAVGGALGLAGRLRNRAVLIGAGSTPIGLHKGALPSQLAMQAIERALADARVDVQDAMGLVSAGVSLAEPRFMNGHVLATKMRFLPHKDFNVATIDTGGASPITGLLEGARMVLDEGCHCVVVVASDAVLSLPTGEFLARADGGCEGGGGLESPIIPSGYARVARHALEQGTVTREQLAMVTCLMSRHARRHPGAMRRRDGSRFEETTLKQVLAADPVGPGAYPHTLFECAKRADGAAAVVLASSRWLKAVGREGDGVAVIGGGEASGPLWPPDEITEEMFSCEEAVRHAYSQAHLDARDIDLFQLYDCFPITFVRALEAVGLCGRGEGGSMIEAMYNGTIPSEHINTHGGLLGFGAPWEAPAMYALVEAYEQLMGRAGERQVRDARRALVYANGGIFSHSAVAILAN